MTTLIFIVLGGVAVALVLLLAQLLGFPVCTEDPLYINKE